MKKVFLAVAAMCLFASTANAAVLRLSSSSSDPNAGNSLDLTIGSSSSMFVWVSTSAGQTITGLSTSIVSSNPAILEGAAHITENPNTRWAGVGEGNLGDLVADTNAFILPGLSGSGISTGDENTFVLHSEVQFLATEVGTTTLAIERGSFDITDQTGGAIPDTDLDLGGSSGAISVAVPEPGSATLLGIAMLGSIAYRRRRS